MMSYEIITNILDTLKDSLDIPYAHYQFRDKSEIEGKDKYIAYFEVEKNRFLADDKVYLYEPQFAIELYTKHKDVGTERELIALFDAADIVWSGGETVYIDTERMYQTVFYV